MPCCTSLFTAVLMLGCTGYCPPAPAPTCPTWDPWEMRRLVAAYPSLPPEAPPFEELWRYEMIYREHAAVDDCRERLRFFEEGLPLFLALIAVGIVCALSRRRQ